MTARQVVPPSEGRGALLVAEREIGAQLRSKSFIISAIVLLVLVLGGIIAGSVFSKQGSGSAQGAEQGQGNLIPVAVVEDLQQQLPSLPGVRIVPVADEATATADVRSGQVNAALVPDSGPAGVRVVVQDSAPTQLIGALTVAPAVQVLNPATANEPVRYIVTFGFGLMFMMAAMTFGATIAQNTVIEKQTRVVEILLSAASPRSLLGGKILGNSALALAQTAAIAAVAREGGGWPAVLARNHVLALDLRAELFRRRALRLDAERHQIMATDRQLRRRPIGDDRRRLAQIIIPGTDRRMHQHEVECQLIAVTIDQAMQRRRVQFEKLPGAAGDAGQAFLLTPRQTQACTDGKRIRLVAEKGRQPANARSRQRADRFAFGDAMQMIDGMGFRQIGIDNAAGQHLAPGRRAARRAQ